ncbi:hypothetical protein [Streptomyces sp. NPDC020681]|uniref:hypothetical protein n=1 Tax=Streptomyces sp. NPDC020681 TaxID=3365083 RepID=UPI003796B139
MGQLTRKKWPARILASAMVVGAAAILPTASAQAGTPGAFTMCNNGTDFTVHALLPPTGNRQGWGSRNLTRGECVGVALLKGYNQRAIITIRSGTNRKEVRNFTFPTSSGVHVNVRGTYVYPIVARS